MAVMNRAEAESAVLEGIPADLLIGGEWRKAAGGRQFPVLDPATGETLLSVADADGADAQAALEAASASQASWAATPPRDRAEILRRAFDILDARKQEFALLITLEMGKPMTESLAEVAYAGDFLRWFSEEAVRIAGDYRVAPNGNGRLLITRQPVGPCLLITPWNFPIAMATRKIGPALAAGCTVICKPAKQTLSPRSPWRKCSSKRALRRG